VRFLIDMDLVDTARPVSPQDGVDLIRRLILPTLQICSEWQNDGRLLAGGPVGAAIHLVLILDADSVAELEELVESLPAWPLMRTTVSPLFTFEGRAQLLQRKLQHLQSRGVVA
jgi:hypothetical protein